MQNLHIEHIEDTILTGDLTAIETLFNPEHISVKMDGIAIVWGTDPATDRFFVCTKAAFNKKKIRLCFTEQDICTHFGHKPSLMAILLACFEYLPRTDRVLQGDFIGFGGGESTFHANTLTYKFDEEISQNIIIAPHTFYYDMNDSYDLREMEAFPLVQLFQDTEYVKWIQPCVDRVRGEGSAPEIDTRNIKFLSDDQAKECKYIINQFIREGKPVTDELLTEILGCVHLANLYQMVIEMKEEFMDSLIIYDAPDSYIGSFKVKQEGFTICNQYADQVKLVDREVFSAANFNMIKAWES
jgi:hypothetical protein